MSKTAPLRAVVRFTDEYDELACGHRFATRTADWHALPARSRRCEQCAPKDTHQP